MLPMRHQPKLRLCAQHKPPIGVGRVVLGLLSGLLSVLLVGCGGNSALQMATAAQAPVCSAEGLTLERGFTSSERRSYAYLPFAVPQGTQRIEVLYGWSSRDAIPSNPLTATTVDLGLWDSRGLESGFRGWGGSRQGRLDSGSGPVFIQADAADRGFEPGPIQPGIWHVELGLAATGLQGADAQVQIRCLEQAQVLPPRPSQALDPSYVARDRAGWYAGDFHMHGYHSNPQAPDWEGVIEQARAAKLDLLMLTDYVTQRHHQELAQAQAANPDLLLWPGREVITYFGHVNVHGTVNGSPEYRHGYGDITMSLIQQQAQAAGALFQINHPTIFPPPLFSNLCRGCAYELDAFTDFSAVDTVEVVTGPPIVDGADVGLPSLGLQIENPFITTAIDWWLDKLRQGFFMTAVSASDSKGVDAPDERGRKGYGSSATQIHAQSLSRAGIREALQAGRAYVQVRGVNDAPTAELLVSTENGQQGGFGSQLQADQATMEISLQGASGQILTVFRDQIPVYTAVITAEPYVGRFPIFRVPFDEGPLGSIWRFEIRDLSSRTLISNPVFLQAQAPG